MKRTTAFPNSVDIRSLANDDLRGMTIFCRGELRRLKVAARTLSDMAAYDANLNFLRELNDEMGLRCLASAA